MSDEDSDADDGRRFEALREAVESEAYLEEGGGATTAEGEESSPAVESDAESEREGPQDPAEHVDVSTPPESTPAEANETNGGAHSGVDAEARPSAGSDPRPETPPADPDTGPETPSTDPDARPEASAAAPDRGDSSEGPPTSAQSPWESIEDSESDGDSLTAEDLLAVSSVLVLGSGEATDSGRVCSDLLCGGDGQQDVVIIAFADTPTDRLSTLQDGVYDSDEIVIIDIGDMANNASATELDPDVWANVTVRPMTNPSDASRLGMVIDDVVSEWEGEPHETRVCFHTVSGLLEYMDSETAFRFLHTLLRRFAAVDAVAHFHMDTEAQSIETLRTLQVLFDEVVSVSEDGTVSAVEL